MVYRKEEFVNIASSSEIIANSLFSDNNALEVDPDYVYDGADEDDEPLEYGSDVETVANREDIASDSEGELDSDGTGIDESNTHPEWTFQVNPSPPQYDTDFIPISAPIASPRRAQGGTSNFDVHVCVNKKYYEHIAGSGCQNPEGYLPHNISVEEMRNCHTVQCLLRKPPGWKSQADDMNFEKKSDCFLTGLADRMPTSFWDMEIEPPRYGVGDGLRSQSAFYIETTQQELDETGLPFHPTCFEIFIQASQRILGYVDIDGLVRIRDVAALQGKEFPVTHHEDVLGEQEQVWKHTAGLEYLVANPVFVPDLAPIVEASISKDKNFSILKSPFPQRYAPVSLSHDPFLSLPPELILIIAQELESPDVAALRLSSRAFTHLPISLWHNLIVTEIPFLYEAWSSDPAPYYWATLLAPNLLNEKRAREKFLRNIEGPITIIREDDPEIADQWIKDHSQWRWPEHPDREEMLKVGPIKLPYERTNWYQLYRDLMVNRKKLKGLRNRGRIWDVVVQIIEEIRSFRERELGS
ncbi:hypothetical protein BJX63DRAFT_414004 [Aspergillus granulosus]|uniref:F-box domain-containing protein n=1 Tax=Aspergillus granulosus TaxID=176169 RepID=A0ABR4GWD0_9EURO